MKGRKPHPTALKVLRGNPSKTALPKNEPQVPAIDPCAAPPGYLTAAAAAEWREWAPKLAAVGLLTEVDAPALAQLCETSVLLRSARADYEAGGDDRALNRVLKLQDEERRLLVEFGMTPSSRTRVTKAAPAKREGNRFAGLTG